MNIQYRCYELEGICVKLSLSATIFVFVPVISEEITSHIINNSIVFQHIYLRIITKALLHILFISICLYVLFKFIFVFIW